MIEFEYISDDRLWASLLVDYSEFQKCLSSEAWKVALATLGSIVEAIFVDHLLSVQYEKKSGTDPLKMQLSGLISACGKDQILTSKTVALSAVVQAYRNLIHPGRAVRLNEVASRMVTTVRVDRLRPVRRTGAITARRHS